MGSYRKKFLKELQKQQQYTDNLYQKVLLLPYNFPQEKKLLVDLRKNLLFSSITTTDAFDEYTNIINKILQYYLSTTLTKNKIEHKFHAYTNLLFMKEAIGKITGSLNAVFPQRQENRQLTFTAIHAKGEYDLSERNFLVYASSATIEEYNKIITSANYIWVQNTFTQYTKYHKMPILKHPHQWFDRATAVIEAFNILEKLKLKNLEIAIEKQGKNLKTGITINTLFFFYTRTYYLYT